MRRSILHDEGHFDGLVGCYCRRDRMVHFDVTGNSFGSAQPQHQNLRRHRHRIAVQRHHPDHMTRQCQIAIFGRAGVHHREQRTLTMRDLLRGVPLIGMIWFLWFAGDHTAVRAWLLVGTIAASCAGVLSRMLQLALATPLRPLHQRQPGFVLPFGVDPKTLNHFNSFPSDHGTVFFTLCAVIWRERPQPGIAAFGWAFIIDLARVYEGYHFPADVAGAIALGLLLLYLVQPLHRLHLEPRILAVAQDRAAWFYMTAVLMTHQIATLFDDLREVGRGLPAVLLQHDVFNGS